MSWVMGQTGRQQVDCSRVVAQQQQEWWSPTVTRRDGRTSSRLEVDEPALTTRRQISDKWQVFQANDCIQAALFLHRINTCKFGLNFRHQSLLRYSVFEMQKHDRNPKHASKVQMTEVLHALPTFSLVPSTQLLEPGARKRHPHGKQAKRYVQSLITRPWLSNKYINSCIWPTHDRYRKHIKNKQKVNHRTDFYLYSLSRKLLGEVFVFIHFPWKSSYLLLIKIISLND